MCVAVNLCDDEIGGGPRATGAPPDTMKMFRIIAASGPVFCHGPYFFFFFEKTVHKHIKYSDEYAN